MDKDTREEKLERIATLEKKLDDLKQVYANDVATSHHEPHQTQQMMQLLERQIYEIEQSLSETRGDEYILSDRENKERRFYLVNDNPNSLLSRISRESAVGEKLAKLKVGDKLDLGDQELRLKEVNPE
ncbi:MAG: hypothetical protein ACE5DX_02210 [Candidatus Dojkabacteria bacterium]